MQIAAALIETSGSDKQVLGVRFPNFLRRPGQVYSPRVENHQGISPDEPQKTRLATKELLNIATDMTLFDGPLLAMGLAESVQQALFVAHEGELYCGYVAAFNNILIKVRQGWPKAKIQSDIGTCIKGFGDRHMWIRGDGGEVLDQDIWLSERQGDVDNETRSHARVCICRCCGPAHVFLCVCSYICMFV